MKKSTKILALVLSLVMVLALMPMGAMAARNDPYPTVPAATTKSVSKSKTATALDNNNETTVTLSLPSAETTLTSDVVFVLDASSCADDVLITLNDMLTSLKDSITSSEASINIGAVVFRANATVAFKLTKYEGSQTATDFEASIADTVKKVESLDAISGSNMPAGVIAAKNMLAESSTSPSRQYMILISDGATYLYTHNDDPSSHYSRTSGIAAEDGGLYEWQAKCFPENPNAERTDNFPLPSSFENGGDSTDWYNYLNSIQTLRTNGEYNYTNDYDQVYTRIFNKGNTANLVAPNPPIAADKIDGFVINSEESMYQVWTTYSKLVADGVNCYTIRSAKAGMTVFNSFMSYLSSLGKGDGTDFTTQVSNIKNDILYAVNNGTVTDVIGSNFDLKSLNTLQLTLNGEKLAASVVGNTVNFGEANENNVYPYSVTYSKTDSGEQLLWTINVPVENAKPVQLSYTLKLANKSTTAGTHGVLDLNGDGKADGTETEVVANNALYTNESAVLSYKDSNGSTGTPENFGKPSVSYYVAPSGGGVIINPTPSPKPTDIPDPEVPKAELPADLNSTDHIAYIIGKPSGNVDPNGQITRAEVATAFYRLLTAERRDAIFTSTSTFSDVSKTQWFNKAVASMANGKYIKGYTDGTFGGNRSITRAEFVAIAARFMDAKSGTVTFSDVSSTNWAYQYISTAVAYGWINGYPDGTFKPDQAISRAEAMKIINTMLARGVDAAGLISGIKAWPDNTNVNAWYYYEIIEATNNHLYEGSRPSEKWSSLQTNYVYDIVKYEHP